MIIKASQKSEPTFDIASLLQHIPVTKLQRMQQVLAHRTRYITVVTEEMYHAYNASAVMRTAECFGIQDVHAIQSYNNFKMYTGIARGAYKWMTVHNYRSTLACYEKLKIDGYRIIATTPHAKAMLPSQISLDSKIAVVFGNENRGLSQIALDHADEFIAIPMLGFTESLNVSVCLSICLYDLTRRLRMSDILWRLSEKEQQQLLHAWVHETVMRS
jgi:tRNA (guanosine-2'-O-)-methyltransferase